MILLFKIKFSFTEADVNTATPSLSNAAATWAGWAVTAVTAKFYRSQSDTPKSSAPHGHSRMFNKPASLGIVFRHSYSLWDASLIIVVIIRTLYNIFQLSIARPI